jgi:hypothetical protein
MEDTMPVGKWRLGFVAVVFLACAGPLQASAEDDVSDECILVGDIAEAIMRERQHGATMDDLVQIELTYPEEQRGLVEVASISAFSFPQGRTEDEREVAVRDFRVFMQGHFCPDEQKAAR